MTYYVSAASVVSDAPSIHSFAPASIFNARMDGISDDPELAQELLKLLHAKLRDARQELQDQRRTVRRESFHELPPSDSGAHIFLSVCTVKV